jgi:hypothetical protein
MFAIISNGVIAMFVQAGTAFEWDGIQYPANWCNLSTPEEKAAIGMVDVVYGQYPNDQYYWVNQDAPVYNAQTNQVDINYTATPKDLDSLKTSQISATNATAYSILLPTDWMVVKAVETGGTVAPAWNTWRQEIRDEAAAQVAAITACTTVAELANLPPVQWTPDPNYVPPTTGELP